MQFTLNEQHQYSVDGKKVDGLTSTIQEAGLISNYASEWYKTRGTYIHLATEYYDKGELDESTVDPEIKGYLESWKHFRKDQDYTPIEIEFKIFNSILMVATTIDRLPGPVDLKSGVTEAWHILQIAFQWQTLRELYYNGHSLSNSYKTPMDVYLDPDGGPPKIRSYKISELKEAYKVYTSMLYFVRWKRSVGINKRET